MIFRIEFYRRTLSKCAVALRVERRRPELDSDLLRRVIAYERTLQNILAASAAIEDAYTGTYSKLVQAEVSRDLAAAALDAEDVE